jgi:WD40 repeat protein
VKEYTKCVVHKNSICKTDLHPNNELIATGSSGPNVEIWQISNGALLNTFYGHKGMVVNEPSTSTDKA